MTSIWRPRRRGSPLRRLSHFTWVALIAGLLTACSGDDYTDTPTGTDAGPEDQYETTLTLERGDSYALVVTESGPALTGFVVLAKLSTAEESTGAE